MLSYALRLVLLFWPLCAGAHSSNWTYVALEYKLVSLWEPPSTFPGPNIRIPGLAPPGWYQPRSASASPLLRWGVWLLQTTPEQTDHDDVQTFESSHLLTNKPHSLIPAQASPGRLTSALNNTLVCSPLANHDHIVYCFVGGSSCFSPRTPLHHTFLGPSQRGVLFSHPAPASSSLYFFRTPVLLQLLMFSILPLIYAACPFNVCVPYECGQNFRYGGPCRLLLSILLLYHRGHHHYHHHHHHKKDDNENCIYIIIGNSNAKNLQSLHLRQILALEGAEPSQQVPADPRTSNLSIPDPPDLYSVSFLSLVSEMQVLLFVIYFIKILVRGGKSIENEFLSSNHQIAVRQEPSLTVVVDMDTSPKPPRTLIVFFFRSVLIST
jgi:hypothetical protein